MEQAGDGNFKPAGEVAGQQIGTAAVTTAAGLSVSKAVGLGLKGVEPEVTARGAVNGTVFEDVNQTARPATLADPNQPTLIQDRVTGKAEATGRALPNGNMADAHAEIGVIQQAYNAGKTNGQEMVMTVTGKDVCGYCKGDIAAAAEQSGLKFLTIQATEKTTWTTKTYYWQPGMRSIKEKP